MDKQTYYLSVDHEHVARERYDDKVHYFEIKADYQEFLYLERQLKRLKTISTAKTAMVSPLSEKNRIEKNAENNELLERVYQETYKLGTEETRKEIEELGILHEISHAPYR